jgi:hypothetical protein
MTSERLGLRLATFTNLFSYVVRVQQSGLES